MVGGSGWRWLVALFSLTQKGKVTHHIHITQQKGNKNWGNEKTLYFPARVAFAKVVLTIKYQSKYQKS